MILLVLTVANNMFVDSELENMAESEGKFAKYLSKILDYYFSYHRDAYSMKGERLNFF